MSVDDETVVEMTPSRPHYVLVMVAGSIAIAFVMVSIALWAYHASGTAQLDLSASTYKEARRQVSSDEIKSFSATGDMNQQTIDAFRKLYDDQTRRVTQVDGFGNGALDDEAIGLNELQPDNPTNTP